MALTMQKKTGTARGELVRNSLEYLGVDPYDRGARVRLYGKIVGTATLTATALGAGAIYLKAMSLVW